MSFFRSFFTIHSTSGMLDLAFQARAAGRLNVAFIAYFLTGQVEEAIELLIEANRIPEATFMARTYLPSQISRYGDTYRLYGC